MKRLYYLTENLDTADDVAKALHAEGVSDWNFHVLSKDEAGLYKHHLHAATPLHQRDLIRTGERGALLGLAAGMAAAIFSAMLIELSSVHTAMVFAIAVVLPTLFGAWLGGLVGLSTENHKITRFHGDIEAGRALLMIDVRQSHENRIRELMQLFPVRAGGEDTTVVVPFRLSHA